MADEAMDAAKAALRRDAHARRAAIPPDTRSEHAASIAALFFRHIDYGPGDIIAGYWRIRDETDCKPILIRLMDSGQKVVLPVVAGDDAPLDLRVWEADAPLYEAGFGTLAPSDLAPRAVPDLILVPLLGFDGKGTRLGYGGGYYDRTVAAMPVRPICIGVGFELGRLDSIRPQKHDIPMDAIVTEEGFLWHRPPPGV